MADGVAITAGVGTTVATDDCGAPGHAQIVKLAISTDGSATLIPADATNGIDVDVTRVKPDGTNTMPSLDAAARAGFAKLTDGTLTAGLVDETGASAVDAQAVGGGTPHDAVDSGNPVKMGAKAIAHGTNPTAVAAGDRTDTYANRAGVQFVIGGHPNAVTSTTRIPAATGAQTDAAIGPGTVSAGLKVVVTRISVTCSNANSVNVAVKVGFGASTLPADSTTGAAGVLVDHEGVPPGGGFVIGNGAGILGVGADGEELRWTCDSPTAGHVIISVTYFTIES